MTVGGTPTRQPGYSVDLLTDVAANGSAYQVYQYNRIILGPSDKKHILSQNTDAGHYNCGDTAAAYGKKIFGQETSTVYYQYYVTPTTDKVADLRFDATRMGQAIAKIKSMVSKGKPVRVWLIHHDGFSRPRIQDDTRTHFLTIIGFSLDRFLYLDPWPHGSRLDYSGGMFPKTRIAFMGELTWDPANLELGIYSPPDYKGLHNYKVIAGP